MITSIIDIKVLGRVHKDLLTHELLRPEIDDKNCMWVYVDFSPNFIPLNTKFDAVFAGADHAFLPDNPIIELKAAIHGNRRLDEIPQGYAVVACLEFNGEVPDVIKALPEMKTWEPNENAIFLATRNSIKLNDFKSLELLPYKLLSIFISQQVSGRIVRKAEVINLLNPYVEAKQTSAERLVFELEWHGYLRERDDETLELRLPVAS